MNLQAYITSGILELYLNGLTTPEETREVEELASGHPEVQAEIDAIRSAMEAYAVAHRVQPPEGLKEKMLNRLHDVSPKTKKAAPAKTAEPAYRPAERVRQEKTATPILPWLLGLALLGAAIAAFVFFSQVAEAKRQATEAQAQLAQLKKDCEEKDRHQAELKKQFEHLHHWATRPVQLKGLPISDTSFAVVYHNTVGKFSYLNVVQLPKPETGKQYQLWALVKNQLPTDMGVFNLQPGADTLISMPFVENALGFAVSLEKEGGNPTPTQIYVLGEMGKS